MQIEIQNGRNGTTGSGAFPVQDRYMTKAEVAEYLGVSRRTVDNFMRRGYLVYHKIGRTVRFKKEDVDKHLNETARVCHSRRG